MTNDNKKIKNEQIRFAGSLINPQTKQNKTKQNKTKQNKNHRIRMSMNIYQSRSHIIKQEKWVMNLTQSSTSYYYTRYLII